jgi:hypothetical protein
MLSEDGWCIRLTDEVGDDGRCWYLTLTDLGVLETEGDRIWDEVAAGVARGYNAADSWAVTRIDPLAI